MEFFYSVVQPGIKTPARFENAKVLPVVDDFSLPAVTAANRTDDLGAGDEPFLEQGLDKSVCPGFIGEGGKYLKILFVHRI